MPPKSAGNKASPRKGKEPKKMGSLSSFQPTLNFPKLTQTQPPGSNQGRSHKSAPASLRKDDDSKRMPPPPLPKSRSAPAVKGSSGRKGKGKAVEVIEVDDDVIEVIDSDDEETPKKRRTHEREEKEKTKEPEAMWSERYAPTMQSDLAPGKARVEKVRDWLYQSVHGFPEAAGRDGPRLSQTQRDWVRKSKRVLLVTGPAGIGKTTTVRLLARSLGIELVEWTESVDDRGFGGGDFESAVSKVTTFLSNNAYPSLPMAGPSRPRRPRVLLMTSLPNLTHLPTRDAFHEAIQHFCRNSNLSSCPLVIVHSDAGAGGRAEESWRDRDRGGLESAADVVGSSVMDSDWCSEIDFLPLAPTFLNKALNRVLGLAIEDATRRPAPGAVQLIALSCNGDLRSAINSLQLLCTGRTLTAVKKRKTGKEEEKRGRASGKGSRGGRGAKVDVSEEVRAVLDSVTRQEQSLNLFHALGKVFYNKRLGDPITDKEDQEAIQAISKLPQEDPLPDHLAEFERTKSMVQMETFIPTIPVDASTFALWIHQNVPSFCPDIDQLAAIMDDFCFADLMRTEDDIWQSSPQAIAYALHLTVRGTLMGLPSPVPRSSQRKVTKPKFFEAFRTERDNRERMDLAAAHLVKKVVASSVAVHDGDLAAEEGLVWGGLLPKTTLACEVVPTAIKIQKFARRPMLPLSVQQVTMPPYAANRGHDGEVLSERDVTGAEDEFGAEVAGEDGMGVPTQGWEVWDDSMPKDEEDEPGWLEDDIEGWSD